MCILVVLQIHKYKRTLQASKEFYDLLLFEMGYDVVIRAQVYCFFSILFTKNFVKIPQFACPLGGCVIVGSLVS